MKTASLPTHISRLVLAAVLVTLAFAFTANAQTSTTAKHFATADQAADALIDAAEKYDEAALTEILGPDSYDILHTGEPARDREESTRRGATDSQDVGEEQKQIGDTGRHTTSSKREFQPGEGNDSRWRDRKIDRSKCFWQSHCPPPRLPAVRR